MLVVMKWLNIFEALKYCTRSILFSSDKKLVLVNTMAGDTHGRVVSLGVRILSPCILNLHIVVYIHLDKSLTMNPA